MSMMLSFPDQGCRMPLHVFKSASVSLQHSPHGSYRLLAKFHHTTETFVDESVYLGFTLK